MEYPNNITIRTIESDEAMLLTEFLYEAIHQPEGTQKVPRTVLQQPMIWAYVKDFGKLPDDICLVAVVDGLIVGAAWSRLGCSYGKIDDTTPEFAISVYPEYRGKGIGTRLLSSLLDAIHKIGYGTVSLSVDKSNYAVGMYLKAGFEILEEREHDYIMVKRWNNE